MASHTAWSKHIPGSYDYNLCAELSHACHIGSQAFDCGPRRK